MKQRTPEWHAMRANRIGASDAPVIMGVSPYKKPFQLWKEKTGIAEPQVVTQWMQRGIDLEDEAREWAEGELEDHFVPTVKLHPKYDWMMASLDGICIQDKIVIEIKCCGKKDWETACSGNICQHHYPQLQHIFAVTDCEEIYIIYYRGYGEGKILSCARDDKYIQELIKKELEFKSWMDSKTFPEELKQKVQIEVNDWQSSLFAERARDLKLRKRIIEEEWDELRNQVMAYANGQPFKSDGLSLRVSSRKGNIDWNVVPAPLVAELEQYRKEDTTTWTMEVKDE